MTDPGIGAGRCSHLAHANDLEPSDGHRVLRAQCPVHRETEHDPPFFVVSRHDDVLDVLRRPDVWRNGDGPGVFFQEEGTLGSTDDPDHSRQRNALRPAFLPSVIARLQPRIEELCAELWSAAFSVDGEGDFVERFAFPYPAVVIAELLGVDPGDRDRFGEWSDRIVEALGGGDLAAYREATEDIWAYVDTMIDARLGGGADDHPDVVAVLTAAHERGELTRPEVHRLCHQLLVAGHETTAGLIGLTLYRLIERPHLFDELAADPSLVDAAVEELLRFDSPVQGLFRTSPHAVTIGDTTIPAATKLQVLFASANRDPDRWDDADEIRLDRDPRQRRQHLAFGWGAHYCIGAPLARLVAAAALRSIVTTFASVELVAAPTLNSPFILRGFTHLPIRWTVRDGS